jgi:hypothetical protein
VNTNIPRREDIRVTGSPSTMMTISNVTTGQTAYVKREGAEWVIIHSGVSSRHTACEREHSRTAEFICSWPTADCINEPVGHMGRKCHGWHTPKAVVAAAQLTMQVSSLPRAPRWGTGGRRYGEADA